MTNDDAEEDDYDGCDDIEDDFDDYDGCDDGDDDKVTCKVSGLLCDLTRGDLPTSGSRSCSWWWAG